MCKYTDYQEERSKYLVLKTEARARISVIAEGLHKSLSAPYPKTSA